MAAVDDLLGIGIGLAVLGVTLSLFSKVVSSTKNATGFGIFGK